MLSPARLKPSEERSIHEVLATVAAHDDAASGYRLLVLDVPRKALEGRPGQFFHILCPVDGQSQPFLRRPMSIYGYDRDAGAIRGAAENAARAGLSDWCRFERQPLSDLAPPDGPAGLVLTNPPYGARIGNRKPLFALYATLGQVLSERFAGWRVGIVTSDDGLAKATKLPLEPSAPVAHGGLKVRLWQAHIAP